MKRFIIKGIFLISISLFLFPAVIFFETQVWVASVGLSENIGGPIAMASSFSELLNVPVLEGAAQFESFRPSSASLKSSIVSGDARPLIIKNYLKYYRSPLLSHSDYIFEISQQVGMDYRLLVAIAQQESNLCKKIPEDSYNCWGWGIHSRGTLKFSSYQEAIKTVAEGIKENYISKGLETPQEIMAKYTPLSNGSWAAGVNQFMEEMEDGSYQK